MARINAGEWAVSVLEIEMNVPEITVDGLDADAGMQSILGADCLNQFITLFLDDGKSLHDFLLLFVELAKDFLGSELCLQVDNPIILLDQLLLELVNPLLPIGPGVVPRLLSVGSGPCL